MKRFLKRIGWLMALLIAGALAYTYISFNYYSPEDPDVEIDPQSLDFYQDSWTECRTSFRSQAENMKSRFDSVEIFSVPLKSQTDNDLTIDFCYVPPKDTTEKLVILISGTHGIEGYVGSAVQQMLMQDFFQPEMFSNTGLLLVHGLNAWGFKHQRPFSENNVDLNRHFSDDRTLFETQNDGFVALYDMLTPKGKLNMNSIGNRFFMLKAIQKIAQKGMPALLQAFAQGQYQFPEGIYFGGQNFEQQVEILKSVLTEKASSYPKLLNLDLHTGFGERGELHLFPNPVDDPVLKHSMEKVFAGYRIDWGDSDNFYVIHGQLVEYIGKVFPEKLSIPMMMEFGTLNTGTTVGAVKSAHISIVENQGAQYGYKTPQDSINAKAGYYEMFYPPSEKWRTNALHVSKAMMENIWENFQKL